MKQVEVWIYESCIDFFYGDSHLGKADFMRYNLPGIQLVFDGKMVSARGEPDVLYKYLYRISCVTEMKLN